MFKAFYKYGSLNTYDILKASACLLMIIDHIGAFFLTDITCFRVIGRASYPLFAFCIGYNKAYKVNKELFIYASIMLIINFLLDSSSNSLEKMLQSSILISIIAVKYFMYFFSKKISIDALTSIFILLISSSPISYILFQYGFFGILFAIFGYLSRNKIIDQYFIFLIITFALYVFIEGLGVDYKMQHYISSFFIFTLIFYIFTHFSMKDVKLPYAASFLTMLLSRYSMIIYILHYEIMYIIARL